MIRFCIINEAVEDTHWEIVFRGLSFSRRDDRRIRIFLFRWIMKWSDTSNSVATAFVLALLVIATFGYLSLNNLKMLKTAHYESSKRGEAIDQIDRLLYSIKDAETNSRAYVITGNEKFAHAFEATIAQITDYRGNLDFLLKGDPQMLLQLSAIDTLVARKMELMTERIRTMRTKGFAEARRQYEISSASVILMDEIADHVRNIEQWQRQLEHNDNTSLELNSANDYASDALLAGLTTLIVVLFFIVANRQLALREQSDKALVASEDRFRLLTENSADGVFVTDVHGTIKYANPAAQLLLGRTGTELLASNSLTYVHADDLDSVKQAFAALTSDEKRTATVDFRITHKYGSHRWIEARSQRMRIENNEDAIISNYRDVTDRKLAETRLVESEEQYRVASERLRQLSSGLLHLQETERRKLALELHDEIGQLLTAVQMNVESARRTEDPVDNATRLEESSRMIARLMDEVRSISLELRPSMLDQFGLASALRWYTDQQARRADLKCELRTNVDDDRFDAEVEITCFRLVQEALTNVLRHAHATSVVVELKKADGKLLITVSDDGKGFEVMRTQQKPRTESGLGLVGMKERANLIGGDFEIISSNSRGTIVRATIPLQFPSPTAGSL